MWIMAFLVAGSVALALSDLFDDDEAVTDADSEMPEEEVPVEEEEKTPVEEVEDEEETPIDPVVDTWEGDSIRVTEEGGESVLMDPTDVSQETWVLDWQTDSFVADTEVAEAQGYDGGEEDTLIETNRFDDVYQAVDAGAGLDQVVIGPGDFADLRFEDAETGDDIDGEGGDMLVVHFTEDDLAEAASLGALLADSDAGKETEFSAELGSEDVLNIVLPDGVEGTIYVLEGTETFMHGSAATGATTEIQAGFVFFVPNGMSFPTSVRYDEGDFWSKNGDSAIPDAEKDGILYLGTLDLGLEITGGFTGCYSCDPGDEVPGNHTEGHDRLVDVPILSVNGSLLSASA